MMSLALLILAAAAPDLAFDAYGKCAQGAAAAYNGPTDSIEAVAGRVQTSCESDRAALFSAAPDKAQAAEWVRMTTTLAVTQHVAGLPSAGSDAKEDRKAAAPAVASRYPKLDAYKACTEEHAAKVQAELPYAAVEAVVKEAMATCEGALKAAADETVAEMHQPALKRQVTDDFRRRAIAELTQKIRAQRVGRPAA